MTRTFQQMIARERGRHTHGEPPDVETLVKLCERLARASAHCRGCQECGDGPCCDACDLGDVLVEYRGMGGTFV